MQKQIWGFSAELWLSVLVYLVMFVWTFRGMCEKVEYESRERKTAFETEIKFRELGDSSIKEDLAELKVMIKSIDNKLK